MGNFGNDYTRRSLLTPDILFNRSIALGNILAQLKDDPTSILEVGCNIGGNLLALKPHIFPPGVIIGVEPCERARRIGLINGLTIFSDCGQELHFMDNFFDLVFTCGVLIHCQIEEARKIVEEMNRVSKRLLMFMEYWHEEDEEIPYRKEIELLWRRPWDKHFKNWGLGYPILKGFLNKEMGFDNVNFWIYSKKQEMVA